MADAVYQKTQFVGTSTESFSDAAGNAVAKAAKVVHNISWFEVNEQRGSVVDGKIQQYQITLTVGYRID